MINVSSIILINGTVDVAAKCMGLMDIAYRTYSTCNIPETNAL